MLQRLPTSCLGGCFQNLLNKGLKANSSIFLFPLHTDNRYVTVTFGMDSATSPLSEESLPILVAGANYLSGKNVFTSANMTM